MLQFQPQRSLLQGADNIKSALDFTNEIGKHIKLKRKIVKIPFRVLDAPALKDDYYLNLVDWSSQNILSVGLGSSVYLWNGETSRVTKLCDLGASDSVTALGWSMKGPYLTVGSEQGKAYIWDVNKLRRVRILEGHDDRIASVSWNADFFSTGSRDRVILHRDPREPNFYFSSLTHHKQEVCGLRWSPDSQQLCSGGNDNKLFVTSKHSTDPLWKFSDHKAAVKAVAWSNYQHGLLASGGGTADKCIKFRNTITGETLNSIDTGSQVCNLVFSQTLNEIVSTHGYSQN